MNVLFVGSFISKSKSGHVGGQMYACNSLINSELSKEVNFILLDTTASTNKKRSVLERGLGGFKRMAQFIWFLMFIKIDTVMVFCSSGFSFKEKGLMIRIAKSLGKKTIIAPRSGFLIDDIESSESFKNYANKVFGSADYIICQGNFWKTFFKEHFSIQANRLKLIHNWIRSVSVDREEPKPDNLKLLFLGWIEKNKGIYDILKAAEILKNENMEWIIGGNGSEFENAKKWVTHHGLGNIVKLEGWILNERKLDLLRSSHIFVLPSYREGLPNALLEAMQAGLAVISTNVGGIPDVIKNDINGFLIEPGDYQLLATHIKSLSTDMKKIETLGQNALETIKKQHSLDIAISKFREILA